MADIILIKIELCLSECIGTPPTLPFPFG